MIDRFRRRHVFREALAATLTLAVGAAVAQPNGNDTDDPPVVLDGGDAPPATEADGGRAGATVVRDTEVSAGEGGVEVSVGLSYSRSSRLENLRIVRSRGLTVPIDVAVGVGDSLEMSAGTSFSVGERQVILLDEADATTDSDIGAFSFGLSYRWRRESADWPSVTSSLDLSVPVGDEASLIEEGETSSDGAASLSLSFTRSVDPVFLFWNVGYDSEIGERGIGATRVRRGAGLRYGFGASFVANGAITFSGRLSGSYVFEDVVDGDRIDGSNAEPMFLSTSLVYGTRTDRRWQANVTRGLNDDAEGVEFGLTYIGNFSGWRS